MQLAAGPATLAWPVWVMIRAIVSSPAVTKLQTVINSHVSAVVDSLFRSGRRGGISSPEVSRLNKRTNDTSAGAVLASSSAIRLSARRSRAFRLSGASFARPRRPRPTEKAVVTQPGKETSPAGEG